MKETCDGDLARFFIYLFLILFFELVVRAVDVGVRQEVQYNASKKVSMILSVGG